MAAMLAANEMDQAAYIESCIEGATRLGDPYIVFPKLYLRHITLLKVMLIW